MPKPSLAKTRRLLSYCEAELAKPDISPHRKAILTEKAEHLARQLKGHCKRCGRTLERDDSKARGIGPTCLHRTEAVA